jgi:hypothetical protein
MQSLMEGDENAEENAILGNAGRKKSSLVRQIT